MKQKEIKKVVLAYSGGLDTSIIIPWLKENYNNCEVIAVSADVGQESELEGLEEKALKTGASKLYIEDLRKEFIEDYIYPTMKAGAVYENKYLLGTSFARPVIAKRIVEIAKKEGADAICHGCTGKGNDQVRFELTIKAFAPEMTIIAPWRIWNIKSRDEEIDYAEAHNIPLKITRETNYSKDKNLWHLSHEGLDLEDPANEPKYDEILELGVSPEKAPDTSFTIGIDTAEVVRQKVEETAPYNVIKVKMGVEGDRELVEVIRSATDKPLCVDANQGWTDKERALETICWLAERNTLFVEQPLPKEMIDETAWLRERSPLPIIADEFLQRLPDVKRAEGVYDGINIKLMKSTGLREAYRMTILARALGMKTMIGCMTETSCAVSAAAPRDSSSATAISLLSSLSSTSSTRTPLKSASLGAGASPCDTSHRASASSLSSREPFASLST